MLLEVRRNADSAQDRPSLMFTTGLRLGLVRLCSRFCSFSMNQLFDSLSDLRFCVHVELAIPHSRCVLAFCDFGPIDFSRLKFVFWEEKTPRTCRTRRPPPAAILLGIAPWTYPRTFRRFHCFFAFAQGSLCRVLHLIYILRGHTALYNTSNYQPTV